MLDAAAAGPSQRPASTTIIGCSVSGTGVPGIGIATCEARATAAAKPTTPARVSGRGAPAERVSVRATLDSLHAEGDRISATEAERGEPGRLVPVLQGVQQRREHARAARADRMPERDGAAVHVDAVPIPVE